MAMVGIFAETGIGHNDKLGAGIFGAFDHAVHEATLAEGVGAFVVFMVRDTKEHHGRNFGSFYFFKERF